MTRARAYCFTYNLPDDEPWNYDAWADAGHIDAQPGADTRWTDMWDQLGIHTYKAEYICMQPEIAPTTGKRHYQGYVYFKDAKSFNVARQYLRDFGFKGCHIEAAKGSPEKNINYCSKTETRMVNGAFREFGVRPSQGRRTDLETIADAIEKGESILDIACSNPGTYIKFHSGIKALNAIMKCKPRDPCVAPTVYWWFGPTGVGKSRKAFESFPEAYVKMNSTWWDGYEGQTTVIIDDYRPSLCTFQELLRVLDRYPMRIQMKGSSCELSATHFVISTTQRPEVLWHGRTEEALNQLLRRITHIVEFKLEGNVHSQKILKAPANYVMTASETISMDATNASSTDAQFADSESVVSEVASLAGVSVIDVEDHLPIRTTRTLNTTPAVMIPPVIYQPLSPSELSTILNVGPMDNSLTPGMSRSTGEHIYVMRDRRNGPV